MKNSCISWYQAIKNHVLGVFGHCWPKGARESTARNTTLSKRNSSKQTEPALCPSQWEAGKGRQIKLTGNAQFIKKAQGHKIFLCPSTKKLFQIPNSLAACKSFTSGPTPCRQAVSDVPIYQVPRSADEGTGLEDTCRANRPHNWESALLTPAQEESNLPPHKQPEHCLVLS